LGLQIILLLAHQRETFGPKNVLGLGIDLQAGGGAIDRRRFEKVNQAEHENRYERGHDQPAPLQNNVPIVAKIERLFLTGGV
jgi:hypothetical protein